MRARLFQLMYDLRASYWFVPSVMALLAIVLGTVTVWLDSGPGAGLLDGLGWYQKAKPDGAQEVLSTIAGSMITVAGVVFSITIVAIAYAASQYGPRILTNFMSDRGNQVTLGTFIATFVYCLVVLRTIRGGDEGEFVPQLAVMVGLFLALCSIAVLIFFIHHVPRSIHINNVAAQIGRQLLHSICKRFPSQMADHSERREQQSRQLPVQLALVEGTGMATVGSVTNGYIESVDHETLVATAREYDLVVHLHHRPGDYIMSGQALLSAGPEQNVVPKAKRSFQRSHSVGANRTPSQDMLFLVDELVEIAARALSTGVNDPYTAMTCLDWVAAATAELGRRRFPSSLRVDRNGEVRVVELPDSLAGFVERGFGRMRQYVSRDMNASAHALATFGAIAKAAEGAELKRILGEEAKKLMSLCESELEGPSLAYVRDHFRDAAEYMA